MKIKLVTLLLLICMMLGTASTVIAAETTALNEDPAPVSEEATTADTDPAEESTSGGTAEDPDESNSSSAEPEPESVQDTTYRYLTEVLGLTPAAAAGIMGNIMIECAFIPDRGAMDVNDLYSYGIMMWNGPRYESLKSWCAENELDHTTITGQLNYLKYELETTEKSAYKKMLEIPNTIEGACNAAILWASDFERCTRTSFGLRIWWTLNTYWPEYAGGTTSDTHGVYGYYYNVPDNIEYGKALTLYGAVVSYSSPLKSLTVGVYTEDGQLVTGKTLSQSNLAGNIGTLDAFVVFNKIPKGTYYYTITAVNEAAEYTVERHSFTVTDDPTTSTLIKESVGDTGCELGAACPSLNFTDAPKPSNWAHAGIDYVLKEKLFVGTPGGIFAPDTVMTRAMFVTVICNLGEKYGIFPKEAYEEYIPAETGITVIETHPEDDAPEDASESTGSDAPEATDPETTYPEETVPEDTRLFTDVAEGSWYEQYVLLAYGAGLIAGTGERTFSPDKELTRAELATLMFRFAKACGACYCVRENLTKFSDCGDVQSWAEEALQWAVAAKLISGVSANGQVLLDPSGYATRAQVASVIQRFVAFIEK